MLLEKLIEYSDTNTYPFHMPGHKRRDIELPNPFSIDITEITDFDDLHHSSGVLKDIQEKAAKLYGADNCYYLVNGSTCGNLAAISAATHKGDRVIVARNSHKSVYHAIYLRELIPEYIYPEVSEHLIQGQTDSDEILRMVEANRDAKAVIITSPTYDGVVSDIRKIADIVHEHGMTLIVDAAHGAHFGLHESMPENPITLGADAVVVSVHKTLPSLTQTALLLTKGGRIDRNEIERFLDIYETSSPSYLLMAGIDRCVDFMIEDGNRYFQELTADLDDFYSRMGKLQHLKVLTCHDFSEKEAFAFDRTKILISTINSDISGNELKRILIEKYSIELEMSAETYALALATLMDTKEGFDRLGDALLEIDTGVKSAKTSADPVYAYQKQRRQMEIHETDGENRFKVALSDAINQISADYIYFYPPGIPILVPGEVITEENIKAVGHATDTGIEVYGLTENKMIFILKG